MSGKHSVNLFISAGGLNLLPNFQKKKKKEKRNWGREARQEHNLLMGVAGEDRGEIFQDEGGGCRFYIKIN